MSNLTKAQQAEKEEMAADMRALCPPGSTIYGIIRKVGSTGTYYITPLVFQNGRACYLTYRFKVLCGYQIKAINGEDCVVVPGTGFHHLGEMVQNMARALYDDFKALNYDSL